MEIEEFKEKVYNKLPDNIPEDNKNSIVELVYQLSEICNDIDYDIRDVYTAISIIHQSCLVILTESAVH